METIIEIFSKSNEIPVFPLRIKNNIKLIPKLFPKLDFKILVSPYTFGLSHYMGHTWVIQVGQASWMGRTCDVR